MNKCLALVLLLVSTQSWAAKEYYALHRSLRALGMGGANYALSDDESAMFYNPAGLSTRKLSWELMLPITGTMGQNTISNYNTLRTAFDNIGDIGDLISRLELLQGKPLSAGLGIFPHYIQENFGFGLLLADAKFSYEILGSGIDSMTDVTAIADAGAFVSYARPIGPTGLHVGLTAKFLGRGGGRRAYTTFQIAGNEDVDLNLEEMGGIGLGLDFDAGAIYEMPTPLIPFALEQRFSFTVNNVLATNFPIARRGRVAPPQLPRYFSLGSYTLFPGWGPFSNFIFVFDLAEFNLGGQTDPDLGARTGSFWKHVNWGFEIPMGRLFTLRTGFHQGLFTAGFGLNLKYMKLDFAWYGVEVGSGVGRINERRLALQLSIGGGNLGERQRTAESIQKARDGGGEEEEPKPEETPASTEEDAKKKSGDASAPPAPGEVPGGAPQGEAPAGGAEPPPGQGAAPQGAPGGAGEAPQSGGEAPSQPGSEGKGPSPEEQAAEEAWQDVEVQPQQPPGQVQSP